MIIKQYELKNINFIKFKILLLYGKNDGQKEEAVDYLVKNNEILTYEQNEIIEKKDKFFDGIYTPKNS